MRGWVYVISNKSMPGLLKIGYSTKDPILRAKELSGTGLPHPYWVEFDALTTEPYEVEQGVHKTLAQHREGKEWFRCSLKEAVLAIRAFAGSGLLLETPQGLYGEQNEEVDLPEAMPETAGQVEPISYRNIRIKG